MSPKRRFLKKKTPLLSRHKGRRLPAWLAEVCVAGVGAGGGFVLKLAVWVLAKTRHVLWRHLWKAATGGNPGKKFAIGVQLPPKGNAVVVETPWYLSTVG